MTKNDDDKFNLTCRLKLFFDGQGRVMGRTDPVITPQGRAAIRPAPPTGLFDD